MKISELIEKLEKFKTVHGDVIVIARDEEGVYEVDYAYASDYEVYDGRDRQVAIRLSP